MNRIKIVVDGESVVKQICSEDSPTWMEITEDFFTALLGFGYSLPRTPEQLVEILDTLRDDI